MEHAAAESPAERAPVAPRLKPWQRELARQLGIVLAGAAAYGLVNSLIFHLDPPDTLNRLGVANARRVVDLERWLHVFREADFYAFITGHALLRLAVDAVYVWLHLPLFIMLAIWLYVARRRLYLLTRNAVLISGAIALACEFWPVAPPYLVPGLHFANTAAGRVYDAVEPKTLFDVYGAVPSIHVAWSLLIGLALVRGTRSLWLRAAGIALPIAMAVAVTATGNHYFFDSFAGVLAAAAGLWLGAWLQRRRERGSAGVRYAERAPGDTGHDGAAR
ncbi:MAG TPA: phosphatase PAP2 family protein [Dehalococcoidia bacterium]|jgi:membrane-associated phospholipid phosphatase|nr:phosphatase PAP2 family protein [Dehalococcoidia bacterium]